TYDGLMAALHASIDGEPICRTRRPELGRRLSHDVGALLLRQLEQPLGDVEDPSASIANHADKRQLCKYPVPVHAISPLTLDGERAAPAHNVLWTLCTPHARFAYGQRCGLSSVPSCAPHPTESVPTHRE